MKAVRIYSEEWAVDARLREVFDASRADFVPIIHEVVGARADAVDDDPINAPGTFAYIHGVRNTRGMFRSKGWHRYRKDGMELVKHPSRRLLVGYQSVDLAAVEEHDPQAISGKGSGARRVINEAQMNLFSNYELGVIEQSQPPIQTGLWHVCVSVDQEDVRAEVSLSSGVEDGNFRGFIERIFLIRKGEWSKFSILPEDSYDAVEFEPTIIRK